MLLLFLKLQYFDTRSRTVSKHTASLWLYAAMACFHLKSKTILDKKIHNLPSSINLCIEWRAHGGFSKVNPPSVCCARGLLRLCVRLLRGENRSGDRSSEKPSASYRPYGRERNQKVQYKISIKTMMKILNTCVFIWHFVLYFLNIFSPRLCLTQCCFHVTSYLCALIYSNWFYFNLLSLSVL